VLAEKEIMTYENYSGSAFKKLEILMDLPVPVGPVIHVCFLLRTKKFVKKFIWIVAFVGITISV